jgi:conjugal transfer pilus assembly protein TraF
MLTLVAGPARSGPVQTGSSGSGKAGAVKPGPVQGNQGGRFGGKKEGFFFYRDEAREQEEKPKAPKPVKTPKTPEKPRYEKGSYDGKMRWRDIDYLSTAEVRQLVEDVKDYAIQYPTPDNVRDYMTLQAVVMEKATRFQQTWAEVLLENPVLNENAKRPASTIASGILIRQERDDKTAAIEEMKDDMGIVFFYADECPFCDQQKTILENFANARGWQNITGVNISREPKAAVEFGVQLVPDLWVVGNVNGKIEKRRISAGLSVGTQIERGILQAHSRWFKQQDRYDHKAYVPVTEFDDYLKDLQDKENDGDESEAEPETQTAETAER